jgi:hypothetical protein
MERNVDRGWQVPSPMAAIHTERIERNVERVCPVPSRIRAISMLA